tara:strand:- start:364 stop:534 length:171 start_codon:yes stop_codon:yes gene_type:complete
MKVGDLVKVKTKYEGWKLALIVGLHSCPLGLDYVVKRLDVEHRTIASPCDLEVVSQ